MKMKWEEPRIDVQQFIPNEYVAACYYGNCNISGRVYMDSNHNGQYDEGIDQYKNTNTACTHNFSVTGQDSPQPQANAFVVSENWVPGYWEGGLPWEGGHYVPGHTETTATPVYNFDNVHVATMDSIHTHERPNHS